MLGCLLALVLHVIGNCATAQCSEPDHLAESMRQATSLQDQPVTVWQSIADHSDMAEYENLRSLFTLKAELTTLYESINSVATTINESASYLAHVIEDSSKKMAAGVSLKESVRDRCPEVAYRSNERAFSLINLSLIHISEPTRPY